MILVGGSGTRLRPAVDDRPKPLAPVDDAPFVVRILDQLAEAGCARAILCAGHRAEQIRAALGDHHGPMELVHAAEPTPMGTGGALLEARHALRGDDVLVLNGDSFTGVNLGAFARWARGCGSDAAIVAVHREDRSAFGSLTLDPMGMVKRFEEKGTATGPGPINAGIYWFRRRALEGWPTIRPLSLERDMLPTIRDLRAWTVDAPFLDIGTPTTYAAASGFFAAQAHRTPVSRRRPHGLLVADRDGTIIEERHYLRDPAQVCLLPGAVEGLRRFATEGYALAIATNQSGIGRGLFDASVLQAVHDELVQQLRVVGVRVHFIAACPHHPDVGCSCRKPAPGLFHGIASELGYAPSQCLVVGDKECDLGMGRAVGARTALVRTGYGAETEEQTPIPPDYVADDLAHLAALVFSAKASAVAQPEVQR